MPPKKGSKAKTPAKATAPAAEEAPATVTNARGKVVEATAAAGRTKRATAAAANTPAKRAPAKKVAAKATPTTTGKRGRPAKAAAEEADDVAEPPKKRGRPAKDEADAVPAKPKAPPKKRGRPPKGGETTKIDADDGAAAEQLEEELVDAAETEGAPASPVQTSKGKGKAAKGRGKKAAVAAPAAAADAEERLEDSKDAATDDAVSGGKRFWLMKAEQEDREETLEDGSVFNTKFTIDDLRAKRGPEPWDGVRNPTACKNMREMKLGDLAFFYASGGKKGRLPGIVGIIEVVKEHEPDLSAFDETAFYYVKNPKMRGTPAKPRWSMVHVEFRKKLSKPVTLKELHKYGQDNGVLAEMQELNMARLSVSKVSEKEWNFIVDELIEGYDEEGENGVSVAEMEQTVSGVTNGEQMETIETNMQSANGVTREVPETDLNMATSTDTLIASDPVAGSKKPSSRAGSTKASSHAASHGPRAASRGRSRSRAGSAQPAANGDTTSDAMAVIQEE